MQLLYVHIDCLAIYLKRLLYLYHDSSLYYVKRTSKVLHPSLCVEFNVMCVVLVLMKLLYRLDGHYEMYVRQQQH